MSGDTAARLTGIFVLLLLISDDVLSQVSVTGSARIMFYNVENLFDIYDDPATDDEEFLPGSIRRWNSGRYTRKLNALSKAIMASGEWEPPELIGLCEVENRQVLDDLVNRTVLGKYGYGIIHQDSPDPRGIDVCLLYRKSIVTVDTFRYFDPVSDGGEELHTRDILYARCRIMNDTFHLFVNHWPSRRGGVLAAEPQRLKISELLKSKADSIAGHFGSSAFILMMGDLNSSPDDEAALNLTEEYASGLSVVNLSKDAAGGSGTYRYQGNWETIDQVLVSSGLLNSQVNRSGSKPELTIIKNELLLTDDPNYPGRSPFPTWRGYRYLGGFSDHLPVVLKIGMQKISAKE